MPFLFILIEKDIDMHRFIPDVMGRYTSKTHVSSFPFFIIIPQIILEEGLKF